MDNRAALLNQLKLSGNERVADSGRPRTAWMAAIGIAVAIGVAAWLVWGNRGTVIVGVAIAEPLDASTAAVRASSLDATGYVVARRQATVSSKITGKVVAMLIEEGQHVRQGEVIARLDDTNAQAARAYAAARLEQARASLRAAQVAYDNTGPVFARHERQFAAGFISAQTFDDVKTRHDAAATSLEVAVRAVDVASADLEVSQRNLDDTIVRAPFDGVVTVKAAQEGEMVSPVSAGGGFTRTGIGTIVDMESLEVEVDVSENFINRVTAGQDARVTLNAYPNWDIPASVIAIIPTADRAKATVRVRVGMNVTDPRILPQMGARVSFLSPDASVSPEPIIPLGVVLPPDAIQSSGDTGVVYVLRDGRLERRAVRLGPLTQAGQIIVTGLTAGTQVATGPFGGLSDGLAVRVESRPEL